MDTLRDKELLNKIIKSGKFLEKYLMKNLKIFIKKKILITGVTGFKGAWLSQWLLKLGSKVYGTGYNPTKIKLFYKLKLHKN